MAKALIAYASRYGSTQEIAQKMAEILQQENIEVELFNLSNTKSKDWPKLEGFNGILVGSGIRIGKWKKEGKKFLKHVKLSDFSNPVGVFVSCGDANEPDKREEAKNKYVIKIIEKVGINVSQFEAFGGMIDLTDESQYGKIMKKMLLAAAKDDPNLIAGEKNDGRDWNEIESFTKKFSKLLK